MEGQRVTSRGSGAHRFGLLSYGIVAFIIGAAGDFAFHALPAHLSHSLAHVLGPDAANAHLLTLAGMLLIVFAVIRRGTRRSYGRR